MFNLINQLNKLSNKNNIKHTLKHIRVLSTEVAVKTDPTYELIKDVQKVSKITTKSVKKKPQKPPFIKNLFLGTFDNDILTYPEVLDKQTVESLMKDTQPIQEYFHSIDEYSDRKLSRQFVENLAKLNLWGLQASSELGCRQLSLTETCKFNEHINHNTSRMSILLNESLGIQTLVKHGSELLKKKYLQALVDGKVMTAYCVSESSSYSPTDIKTTAVLSSDDRYWILNGEKAWIGNGNTADLFVVLAQTKFPDEHGLTMSGSTAFLVERSFGGITSKPCNTIGLEQTDISDVCFENTPIPVENVIGKVNNAQQIITSILPEFRVMTGPICIALLRKAIDKFVGHCIEIDGPTNNISTSEAFQSKIGEAVNTLYAIESMTYLTSSLIDEYENQDCELETAILKIFSAEQSQNALLNFMKCIGSPAYVHDHWCSRLYRDSLSHLLLHEHTENMKLILALFGMQYAGIHLNEQIKIYRNPLFHPATAFKRMWTQRRQVEDRPKLNLKLHEYLHPSATFAAQLLEYSVLRLKFATETLLVRHGPEVISQHVNLIRLAECAVDIYAMTAVLGRASRSYCIGLQHSAVDMQIANAFCLSAKERVQKKVQEIWTGSFSSSDEKLFRIAKQTFKSKGYFPDHPLARNF